MAPIAKIVCVACTVIGALLLAMGFVVEDMVKSHLTSKASTFSSLADETSPLFPVWRGDDDYIERYMTYYFYNVSNSVAVRQWGAIPAVTVVGPFTYREHAQKFNITWNEDRTKISYLLNRTFTFVDTPCPSGSSFSWTDSDAPLCSLPNTTFVTTANIPLLAIVQQFQNYGWIELDVMNRFIKNINGVVHNESLFPALPVGGMLFGYNDTIMDKLNSIIHDIDDYFNLTYTPRPEFYSLQQRSLFEAIVPSVVSSGAGAASDVGNFDVWAGISQLNMWNGTCNESVFNFEVPIELSILTLRPTPSRAQTGFCFRVKWEQAIVHQSFCRILHGNRQ